MRKQYPVGWLIAVLLLVTAGSIVLLLVPFRTCPLCLSMGFRPGEPRRNLVLSNPPIQSRMPLNCPTCGDSGRVRVLRAWRSPRPAPQVVSLLAAQDKHGRNLHIELESILVACGKDPEAFLGKRHISMDYPLGEVRFVSGTDRGQLLVLLSGGSREGDAVILMLLGADGAVLDVLSVLCISPRNALTGDMLPFGVAPGTAEAHVSIREETQAVPSLVWWFDERGRIPAERTPAPFRAASGMLRYGIGVEADRLKIIPSAGPTPGP